MSDSLGNIGDVSGTITLRDNFAAVVGALDSLTKSITSHSKRMSEDIDKFSGKVDKAADHLKKLGDSGREMGQGILRSLGPVGALADRALMSFDKLRGSLDAGKESGVSFGASLAKIGAGLTSLLPLLAAVAVAVIGLGAIYGSFSLVLESVKQGMEVQEIVEKLNASLRSNGSSAGYSAAQLSELADSLSLIVGIDDDEILKGITVLTRFDKIGHDIFPAATKAAIDLSKATGKPLAESFALVGKALTEPGRAMAALFEAGIKLTKGQKETLQALLDTGHTAEYQSKIMELLQGAVGGTAEALGQKLGGQLANVKTLFGNFHEAIASEVIPALEDMVNDLVGGEKGWKALNATVQDIGHSIGNFVREMVYGVIIAYHEWSAQQNIAFADMQDGLRKFFNFFAQVASGITSALAVMPPMFGGSPEFDKATKRIQQLQVESNNFFAGRAEAGRKAAQSDIDSMNKLIGKLLEHRQALDADTEVWDAHNAAIEEANKKAKELAAKLAAEVAGIKENIRANQELIKILGSGATQQQIESIKRQHTLHAAYLSDVDKFGKKAAESLKGLRTIDYDLEVAADKAQKIWDKLQKTALKPIDLFKGSASAKIDLGPLDAELSLEKKILETVDEISGKHREKAKLIAAAQHLYEQNLISLSEMNRVIADQAIITEKVLTKFEVLWQTFKDAGKSAAEDVGATLSNALVEAAFTGKVAWKDLGDSLIGILKNLISTWLQEWFAAMAQWLARWIATQVAAKAASAALGSSSGSSGSGGLVSAGTSAAAGYTDFGSAGAAPATGYTGGAGTAGMTGSTVGTYAAWAFLAFVGIMTVYKGFIEKGTEWAEQNLSGIRKGNAKGVKESISARTDQILQDLDAWSKVLDIDVSKFNLDVVLGKRNGLYYVKQGFDAIGEGFKTAEEAMDYAKVSAIRFAEFGAETDELIKQVIQNFKGKTTAGLAAEIDFARSLQNAGKPQEVIETTNILATARKAFVDNINHIINALGNGSNMLASTLLQNNQLSLAAFTQQRDLITGKVQDEKALNQARADAWNTQKHLMEAEAKAKLIQIDTQIAAINARLQEGNAALVFAETLGRAGAALGMSPEKAAEMLNALNAQREALLSLLNDLGKLGDIKPGDIRPGGRGNGAGASAADARKQFDEQLKDIVASGLGPAAKALYDYKKQLADLAEQQKKNKAPIADYKAALAELDKQFKKNLLTTAQGYAGIGDSFTQKLQEGLKFFQDLQKMGREKSGIPDWLLKVLHGKFLDQMRNDFQSRLDQFAGVTNPMTAISLQAGQLTMELEALANAGVISAKQFADAKKEILAGIDYQKESGINSILGRLFTDVQGLSKWSAEAVKQKQREIELQYDLIRLQLAGYGVLEKYADLVNDAEANALKNIKEGNSATTRWTQGAESAASSITEAADNLKSAVRSLKDYQLSLHTDASMGLVNSQQALANAKANYEKLAAGAQAGDLASIQGFQAAAELYRKNLLAFSPDAPELTANTLTGIDNTLSEIIRRFGAVDSDPTAAAFQQIRLAMFDQVANDNQNTDRHLAGVIDSKNVIKTAVEANTNQNRENGKLTTLSGQKLADEMALLKAEFKSMSDNVIAWRTEKRGVDDHVVATEDKQLKELEKINTTLGHKKKIAGTG